jgi:hypothetical protein
VLLDRGGAVVPVKKNDATQGLTILLTSARVDVNSDWRSVPEDTLLEMKRDLATSDGILLRNIPLADFDGGKALSAQFDNGIVAGDFDLAVASALPTADQLKVRGLGAKLNVTIEPRGADAKPHGGGMSASIEVQRQREAGQDGDVATGTVNLEFSAGFLAERLGESNVSVAAPVLACAMKLGPARAGECRSVPQEAIVDETGVVPP